MKSIEEAFRKQGYITDHATAVALRLVTELGKPLLVEGPAGVGKTDVAKVLADVLNTRFIRLQCYEGIDVNTALYEWNYSKQMLHIRLSENESSSVTEKEQHIFSENFLLKRPLLDALMENESAPVLLIDEVDRADEAFEAFLLEVLGEFQITIPELGTIRAHRKPYVILTSNRSRELSDALRRRCLYQWIDYPDFKKEMDILYTKMPGIEYRLAERIAAVMNRLRDMPLNKVPGVAESLDWARALIMLYESGVTEESMDDTLGCIIKDYEDWQMVKEQKSLLRENSL